MATNNDRPGFIRRTVEFNADTIRWLDENYPKQLWWICNELLLAFREATGPNLPIHYMRMGAKELASTILNIDEEATELAEKDLNIEDNK